jgi:hypothetical protein
MSVSASPLATELRVDVSAAAGTGERLTVAATVLVPDGLADAPDEPRAGPAPAPEAAALTCFHAAQDRGDEVIEDLGARRP